MTWFEVSLPFMYYWFILTNFILIVVCLGLEDKVKKLEGKDVKNEASVLVVAALIILIVIFIAGFFFSRIFLHLGDFL